MLKFKVGDKVIYNRGESAVAVGLSKTIVCIVISANEEYVDGDFRYKYSQPIYTVEWPPHGRAIIVESDLSPVEES